MNVHMISLKPNPFLPKLSDNAAPATRRSAVIFTAASPILLSALCIAPAAGAFNFRMTTPDKTVEEAEDGLRPHARSLVKVKDLLMSESWREAQNVLRKSAAALKIDIYIIIQSKPLAERRRLRELYSELFNAASEIDYAAMDEDKTRVWENYTTMVSSLEKLLSRL